MGELLGLVLGIPPQRKPASIIITSIAFFWSFFALQQNICPHHPDALNKLFLCRNSDQGYFDAESVRIVLCHSARVNRPALATKTPSRIDNRDRRTKLTCVPRRIVPELMTIIERRPHADPAPRRRILLPHEPQLDLQLIGVWMATVRRLEQSSRVSTFRHEHLDRVVDVGFL